MAKENPFQAYNANKTVLASGNSVVLTTGLVEPWEGMITLDTNTTIEIGFNGGMAKFPMEQYNSLSFPYGVKTIEIENTGANSATIRWIAFGE